MAQTMISEALTPDLLNQLAIVLAQLSSPDNAIRTAAETQLNEQLTTQYELLLSALSHIVRQHQEQHLRSFAAILLRRLALKQAAGSPKEDTSYYVWIGEPARQYIQNELLQSLQAEQVPAARRKIADTIAELGKHMLLKGSTWNELLHAIFECARSPAAEHKVSAFQIIAQVPGLIADTDVASMKRFFGAGLQDGSSEVRLEALHASVAYMVELEPSQLGGLVDFLPQMLNILPALGAEERDLETALGYLIELGDAHPKALRNVVPQLIQFTTELMKNEELEMSTRQTALEMMMTLAEAAPAMMRKHTQFCQTLVPILLEWMGHMEESESWFTSDDIDDDDNEADDIIAGEALDRLARALGGKTVLPVTFSLIPAMLASEDWRKRHGALMTISAIAEGCAKIMEAELAKVLNLILPHLRDPHPRVQWATCNAVGQMSTDFAPTMQTRFAEMVLSNLVPVLDYRDFPRVQTHAAAALVNFCQEVEKDAIAPFLSAIFEKLLVLLNTGKTYVQEQAITTIATVADSAAENFVNYYSSIMPLLMNVLKQANSKEFRLLRGKAMECATLIALAVGKDTFAPDAGALIELLRVTQESITDPDDPQSSYLLAAWARICKVLEADFVPYLSFVLPPLMKSAQLKPDFALIDSTEDEETIREKYDEDWEMLEVDGQRIGIKTTVLEEKCTAVEMLICYARELGPGFAPYVKEVMAIVVPLLRFYFHEGVRHAAAATIPYLFVSILKAQVPREQFDVYGAWNEVLAKIVECIKDELDSGFLAQLYTTTQECLEAIGPNSTSEELRRDFVTATISQLEDYFRRASEREASRQDVDYDAEGEEAIQVEEDSDDMFLADLSTALHQFLKNHRDAYLPQFDLLAPYVHRFLTSSQTPARQWAICVFDDVIEFAGPASARYQGQFWESLAQAVVDESFEVRQAAAYGVGVAAQFGGPTYTQACASALPKLFAAINAPRAREEENILATENAISAVGKICQFLGASGAFDLDQVLAAWVAALPITEDTDEAPFVYSYLMQLIQQNNQAVLGAGNANVPKLALILAEVLANKDLLAGHVDLTRSVVDTLRQFMGSCDEATRGQLWNSITPEKRKVLVDSGYV
ncbi:hypothetical protein PhCBS80983_g00962 [Powellomyces hirtus]|uniref:Importin N-terminal domain-containing protein n=1 Tax=Powellomyces hirtus TaxID=109895 RepID=A0A507ED81_9FUNG|nr:armadillo-type protein [Powellomyces hirtus]TPX61652.1 hypothetical protein PhCBS80983_g00962 [Powellomyces hirtus]